MVDPVFTEEMLTLAPFAKVFVTGLEDPLKNTYCFFYRLCKKNKSMKSRGWFELKRHYQCDFNFRIDQGVSAKDTALGSFEEEMPECYTVQKRRKSANSIWSLMCLVCVISVHFTMMWRKGSPLLSRQILLAFVSKLNNC